MATSDSTVSSVPGNPHPPGTSAWVMACKQRLADPFPIDLIEEKQGLAYLPHEVIRQRLIEATGNCFDWTIDQILFRDDGVTRRVKDRTTGETPRPLSMVVVGRLAIPELGTRAGIGAHPLDAGAGEDAAFKNAESDALKRAAMAFGDCAVGVALFSGRTSHETPAMTILLLVPIAEQRHCARNENRADDGGINSAAAQLGVGRPTNYRWMDDCSLDHDHDEVSGRTFLVPQRPDIRRPVAAELIAWMTS